MHDIYEGVLAATPDFIYAFALDHRFIYANKALLEMWGRTKEEAIGLSLLELGYEPWHARMHDREIDQVIATKKAIKGEVPFTGTNGRRIYEYIFSPILNEKAEVTAIAGTTRDVTERKEAEAALLRSEENGRIALEACEFVGTWNWNLQTNLVMADERFALLHSVDPKRAAKGGPMEDYLKFIHPDDVARILPAIKKVTTQGGEYSEEYRLIRPDGSFQWVITRGRLHLDDEGKPFRFVGAAVDITERKVAEEQLRQSEQELRLMTDALPQQIWTARPDGQIDYINAYASAYGGGAKIGDRPGNWKSPIHPEDLPKSTELWNRSIATGEPYEVQQRILHKDSGKYRWHLSRAVPVRNGQNVIIKWFGTNTDIEDQKQAADAVSEAREHLSLMVESAQDYAILSVDIDGIIISWNAGAERVFGYTQDEIVGKPFSTIFTPEDREHNIAEYEIKTAREKGRAKDERWHLRKNGQRFYASGTMAAMHDNYRQVKGFIKIARDMTREQEAQQALINARNAAEAANIAKTDFLANMSHEIRTPMNAVVGLAHILAMSQPLTDRQREFIKTLQLSADSLLTLLNDMLDIAKIESRTAELEKVPFSLAQMIREIISMMGVRVREKQLQFTADYASIDKRAYLGDPTRLRQIIVNLCSNAVKFTEKGGVHISVAREAVADGNMENIRIIVQDTGIGIESDKLEAIFQKFVQADTSINRKYGGSGLGLAITKTLTEIMNGTITVESIIGGGSIFKVVLPLEIATEKHLQQASGLLSDIIDSCEQVTIKSCILLVEDYPPNVMVTSNFLEQFGYSCEVATNGQEAIDKIKAHPFSVVLMDVQMQGMNGLEATRLIRAHEKQNVLPRLPIIGMTAHALSGDRELCLNAGMDDYIAKPFNPDELRKKIDMAVRPSLSL